MCVVCVLHGVYASWLARHTAFHDSLQTKFLGPEKYYDTGPFEALMKAFHQMHERMTNRQPRNSMVQMANAIQKTDRQQTPACAGASEEGRQREPRGTGAHKLTGLLSAQELQVDAAAMAAHDKNLDMYNTGVIEVKVSNVVRWRKRGGHSDTCDATGLSNVSGPYYPVDPPAWDVDGEGWHQNKISRDWWLCMSGDGFVGSTLHWATTERVNAGKTLLAVGSKYGGNPHFVLKHNINGTAGVRPVALRDLGLISETGDLPVTMADARLDVDVEPALEPAMLPSDTSNPDLPPVLAELLWQWHAGDSARPVHLVYQIFGAAVTPTGGLNATSDFYNTGRPRRSVARRKLKQADPETDAALEITVTVRSLLTVTDLSASATGNATDLALVRATELCAAPEGLSDDAVAAWGSINVEIHRKGAHVYELCELGDLCAVTGYSTQTSDPDGEGVVACVAPWVGNH